MAVLSITLLHRKEIQINIFMQQHSYPQKHKKFENDIFQYLTVGLKDTWGKKKS